MGHRPSSIVRNNRRPPKVAAGRPKPEGMKVLQERRSCVRGDSLRIDVVLQGERDSAQWLTGVHCGVVTLPDGAGGLEEYLLSSVTEEKAQKTLKLWGELQIFECLGRLL